MATQSHSPESATRASGQFATTHWSTVLAAGESASAGASEALEKLCRTYWSPVYVFVRRQGYNREQAEDLTFEASGKSAFFVALSSYLPAERGLPAYAEVARQLAITEGAVKVGVHRLRLRYRELLRAVVAQTVVDPAEIDDEIRFLFQVLSR